MISKIFLFEMEWTTVLILLGVIIGAILLIYLLLTKHRFKKGARKAGNQLSVKYSMGSNRSQAVLNEIKKSPKYNGTYKSLSGRAKKRTKKYLYGWFEEVPFYALVAYKSKSERTPYIHICVSESYDSNSYIDQWVLLSSKSKANNFKRLIKLIDKNKVCFATFEVLLQVFDFEKDHIKDKTKKIEIEEYPSTSENSLFVKYVASTKKVIRK